MLETTESVRERFRDAFNATDGSEYEGEYDDNTDASDVLLSDDRTVMLLPEDASRMGVVERDDYDPAESWTMGYTEYDDETRCVYVFSRNGREHVINADKLDTVAEVVNRTPAEVASDVRMNETKYDYPVIVELDRGWIVIAPVANTSRSDVEIDD